MGADRIRNRDARAGDEHVNRRHDEQGKDSPDHHARHEHDADAVTRAGPWTGREHQWKMPHHRSCGRHENRTQPRRRGLDHRGELVRAGFSQVIRELHDEDAVLGDETHERDQPHLAVDVQGGEAEEREQECAGQGQRHRPGENDERVAKALELSREHEVDQDGGQQERAEELTAFGPELPRLACIIDREALRQDLPRLILQKSQRLVERHRRRDDALDADGIQLLELLQIARFRRGPQRGERRQRDEPIVRAGDVDLAELIGRQPLGTHHLRNDLVAASLDAETVDVVGAEERREVAARLAEIDALRPELVAIEHHLRLRLVEFQIRIRVDEHPARERLFHELLRQVAQLLRFCG